MSFLNLETHASRHIRSPSTKTVLVPTTRSASRRKRLRTKRIKTFAKKGKQLDDVLTAWKGVVLDESWKSLVRFPPFVRSPILHFSSFATTDWKTLATVLSFMITPAAGYKPGANGSTIVCVVVLACKSRKARIKPRQQSVEIKTATLMLKRFVPRLYLPDLIRQRHSHDTMKCLPATSILSNLCRQC